MIPVSSYLFNMINSQISSPRTSLILKNFPLYTCDALPDLSPLKWNASNIGASPSVAGGILSVSVPSGFGYSMAISNPSNNSAGTILRFKAQFSADAEMIVILDDGVVAKGFQFYANYSGGSPSMIVCPVSSEQFSLDLTALHEFIITIIGNTSTLYVDGVLAITSIIPDTSSGGHVQFGFSSGSGTQSVDLYPVFLTTDISKYVKTFGSIQRRGDAVISGDITTEVDNTLGIWNDILKNSEKYLVLDSELRLFFEDSSVPPPPEFITLQKGKLSTARFNDTYVDIGIKDKFYFLGIKKVGTDVSPVSFTNVNPADLLWSLLTTYGGLDSTASTANVDIDYSAWSNWKTYCTSISIKLSAEFKGEDVLTLLQTYIKTTNSAVYCENDGRIRVIYWGNSAVVPVFSINGSKQVNVSIVDVDSTDLYNQQEVFYGYDPLSQTWSGSHIENNTTSQSAYGIIPNIIQDATIWHYNSASALNLAQRLIVDTAFPAKRVQIKTMLSGFLLQVFDGITLTDRVLGLTGQAVRLEQFTYDTDKLEVVATGKLLDSGFTNYLKLDDTILGMLDSNLLL